MFESVVEAVLSHAKNQPEKFCIADDNVSLTYSLYAEKILKTASFFKSEGFVKSSKIVVEANQTAAYLSIQLAMQLLGIIFIPVEHNCAHEKIANFIGRAGADAVIVNNGEADFDSVKKYSFDAIEEKIRVFGEYEAEELPKIDDVCEILFSTGTTGREKGIVISNRNNIALAGNVMCGVKMEKDNVEMIPSPMNHSHGLRRYYANMVNGSSVVILGSIMNMSLFFANIEKYGVNSMDIVPSALAVALRLSKNKLSEYADRIRYIQFGSAPLADDDVKKVCELLPDTRMYNFYGSTESGCTCIYDFNVSNRKNRCIGKPTVNTKVEMVDDKRRPIESSPENTGSISTFGGMNMVCYWDDEEETKRAMENGIVYSNDIGYFDEDGDIILIGRKGDVINIGGNKVSPDEIENAAKRMPGIADCGCIAVSDDAKGQVPKLFVQMSPSAEFDSKEISSFLFGQLEPYKVPPYIVEIEKIPRTFNGKLLRKDLV